MFATPITSERAPRACASRGAELRQPGADRRFGQGELADAQVARPVAQAKRRLGVPRLGRISQEQEIRRGQGDHERRGSGVRDAGGAHCRQDAFPAQSARQNCAPIEKPIVRGRMMASPAAPCREWTRRGVVGDALLVAQVLAVELEGPVAHIEPGPQVEGRVAVDELVLAGRREVRRSPSSDRRCRRSARRRRRSNRPTAHS